MSKQFWAQWDGEALKPLQRYGKQCADQLVIGEKYAISPEMAHSDLSRAHQFAWLHDAWLSLPESLASLFLNEEQMRKFALIAGGFCTSQTMVCSTKAEALRWAQFIRGREPYSLVKIEGSTVWVFEAESQSKRAMGAKRFQESKQAVLDYVETLLEQAA